MSKIVIMEDSEETQKIAKILIENGYEVEINPNYIHQKIEKQHSLFQNVQRLDKQCQNLNEFSNNSLWYQKFTKK